MFQKTKLAILATSVVLLAACGGTDPTPAPLPVASANATVNTNATIASAVANTPFTFGAVPALGTTAATTLAFTSTGTTPAFSISSGGATATGTTNFGSCIFVVASSNFPAGHPLANGATVTVNPCTLNIATAGQPADSIARPRSTTLQLGGTTSTGQSVAITINSNGTVTINNTAAGNVTLVQISG